MVHGVAQQLQHGGPFVQEEPHVALWFGRPGQGPAQRRAGLRPVSLRVSGQRLQHADLHQASGASGGLGGLEQALQQAMHTCSSVPASGCARLLRNQQAHEREVVELAQIARHRP